MGGKVAEFANDEECKGRVDDKWVLKVLGGRAWFVNPERDIGTSEYPVVRRVLEDIPCRHGGIAESVNKESLEFALQEV